MNVILHKLVNHILFSLFFFTYTTNMNCIFTVTFKSGRLLVFFPTISKTRSKFPAFKFKILFNSAVQGDGKNVQKGRR